ncbi:MAG: response regulator [Bacteroidetes bacterium]|nr:response regulator [Bacteroidota bacterium]
MLVDDNDIDNFINERMIQGCNFAETVYVNTGTKSAIEFLANLSANKELRQEHLPQLIFLDINMPILDGYQFLDEFRSLDEKARKGIKVAMLTSSIDPKDLAKAKDYPEICAFLHKPLTEEALASINTTANIAQILT